MSAGVAVDAEGDYRAPAYGSRQALRMPDVVRILSSQGAEPVGNTPEKFTAFVKSEIGKWADLVKVAKMKAD